MHPAGQLDRRGDRLLRTRARRLHAHLTGRRVNASPGLRLHHRRRRLGRLHAGISADRGPRRRACCCSRRAAGTATRGCRSRSPGAGSCAPQARLDVFRRARGDDGRARPRMRARQGGRRLVLDQCDGLCARPPRRLRPLGRERPAALVLRACAALFPPAGKLGRRRRRISRRRRAADDAAARASPTRWSRPSRRPARRPGIPRPRITTAPGRKASAAVSRRSATAGGAAPRSPICGRRWRGRSDGRDRRAGHAGRARRTAAPSGSNTSSDGERVDGACRARGDPRRRRHQLAAAADAVGDRRPRRAAGARHRGRGAAARRRRQPAGPHLGRRSLWRRREPGPLHAEMRLDRHRARAGQGVFLRHRHRQRACPAA